MLGCKVLMEEGRGLKLLAERITAIIQKAAAVSTLADHAAALGAALQEVYFAVQKAWSTCNPTEALASAVPYMQAFGHTVLAWIWLAVVASRDLTCAQFPNDGFE